MALAAGLAACGPVRGPCFCDPTAYRMILQDGTVDPGALKSTDYYLEIFLRPQPGTARKVASGSLTLQGNTFRGTVMTDTLKYSDVQPGDVGLLGLQLCRDVKNGRKIDAELNFYDASGALLEQGHATIGSIVIPHPCS